MLLETVLVQLKSDEGFRSYAYQDSLGYWTIGYGKLIDRRKGGGLTEEEAEFLLINEVDRVIVQLDENLPWWLQLDESRMSVLINMCFNLGINGLLKFKNTLAHVRAGRYEQASVTMMKSLWAKQVPNRAKRLAKIMKGDS